MADGTTMNDNTTYVCPLSEAAIKVAKLELREDQQTREFALIQMREWVKKNPRIIHCRTDDSFLLRFLRVKKFSLPIAQETLERYLLLRHVYGTLMFYNLDIKDPVMDELLNLGYLFVTPKRDKHNRRVIIARPGVFDPHKYTNAHMCHFHAITYETLMEDEENQVMGYTHIADGDGFSFPHLTLFTPREAIRIVKNGERVIPMRHKEVHGLNAPPGLKYVIDFGIALVSEKIRKRIQIHSNLQELHEHLDKSILPKEYGGDMPMSEMIQLWKEELYKRRDILLSNDQMAVKLEMYNQAAKEGRVSALKTGCGIGAQNESTDYVTGSFRQLAVD